jgi:cobalt transporter subunit CbtA
VLRRILLSAVIAGSAASLVWSAGVFLKLEPLIRAAEVFEHADPHPGAVAGTEHHDDGGTTAGAQRVLLTLVSNLIAGIGFALVLTAAIAWRGQVDGAAGVLWGLAGFATFSLAPSLGLPPELPGMVAADLAARQLWWATAAAAMASGLALLVFARARPLKALGVAIAAAPHVYGAPAQDGHGAVPAELAASFAAGSLVINAGFWIILGWLIGVTFGSAETRRA